MKQCLASIAEYTNLTDTEIVVVANGAGEETRRFAKGLTEVGVPVEYLHYDKPIGATRALNEGIKVCRGEYIVLLNDDVILLPQSKNQWIDMMMAPFSNPKVAITGPLKTRSPATNCEFILFFCAMIRHTLFYEIGLLDECFNPGAGEDMDFAMKAKQKGYGIVQVPHDKLDGNINPKFWSGEFPIYHAAEGTVHSLEGVAEKWQETFARNFNILRERYGFKEKTAEFSIVIPTCSARNLQACVSSIVAATDLTNGEVVIVANGAEEDARYFAQTLGDPFRLVWFPERIGATRALNEGVRASRGEYIVFINDDAVILNNNPEAARLWLPTLIEPLRTKRFGVTGPLKGYASDVDRWFVMFFCAAVRRDMFDKVGLFDETFNPGGFEDMDFCFKVQDAGYQTIQVPKEGPLPNNGSLMIGNFPIFHQENHASWMTPEHFERCRAIIRERYGFAGIKIDWPCAQKPGELMALQKLLSARKIKKVLEIGVYRGGSAMFWAKMVAPHDGMVYAVDQRFDWGGFTELAHYYPRQVYDETPLAKHVTEIEGDSHDWAIIHRATEMAGQVDVLFIDGDHTYEGVRQDFEAYSPSVRPGGLIVFHDILDSDYHRSLGVFVSRLWEEIKGRFVHHEFFDPGEYPGCPGPSMGIGVLEVPS